MKTIEIDFDVFKALTARRSSEDVTENDVLRELLGLPRKKGASAFPAPETPAPDDWIAKGVRFPAGTEFRAHYKGQTYLARVAEGALVFNGQSFDNPSPAAMQITGNPVNGWTFWECRLPGQTRWQMLKSLRPV
jgi:predicted CopG family antitoxin